MGFVFVWIYYAHVAIPVRSAWKYEVKTTYERTLPPPAFVVAIGDHDAAYAQFRATQGSNILTKCFWPEYDKVCHSPFAKQADIVDWNSTRYGRLWYISHIPDREKESYTELSQKQLLQVFMSCLSTL
jgi:hypothetical protein